MAKQTRHLLGLSGGKDSAVLAIYLKQQNKVSDMERKYMPRGKPYDLTKFLSDRFDKIKEHVEDELEELIAKPPLRSESKTT